MKMKKLILSAATLALALTAAQAQQIHVGGYTDFTSTGAAQIISKTGDADWNLGNVVAEFGPVQNGIHFLNFDATAKNVEFHTGVWLGSGIGTWYGGLPMFVDRTKDTNDGSPLLQLYVVAHFWYDQIRFYSGNFAGNGFNAGYVLGGYAGGSAHVDPLAMRGDGEGTDSAFTGIEIAPFAIPGFKAIIGFPVAPIVTKFENFNSWSHFFKTVKFMAQYKWLQGNMTFNAGVRPGTYGTSNGSTDYTKSKFGEAFFQIDAPGLIYGFPMNFSYDFRWRTATESGDSTLDGKDWSAFATSHMLLWSMKMDQLVPGWSFAVEDRFGFYAPHYIAINEEAVYNNFGFTMFHNFNGTPYAFGLNANVMYGQDANGTMISRNDVLCSDLITYAGNFMADLTSPGAGAATRYLGVYAYPYVQKNFQNGFVRTGVELQYNMGTSTLGTNQTISWRVPIGLVFWW